MATLNSQTDLLAAALAAGLAPTKPQLSTAPAEKAMVSRATWTGVLSFNVLNMNVKTFKSTEPEKVELHMVHACNHTEIEAAVAANNAIDAAIAAGTLSKSKAKYTPVSAPDYKQLKQGAMKCPVCDEAVERAAILKGYEYADGEFAIVTDDEKKACQVANEKSMPIEKFVDVNEIDPVYFAASEYIAPADEVSKVSFAILRQSMVETNKVAIAKTSQRGRQETVVIRPYGGVDDGGMIVSYLYFDNEVRGCDKWTKVNLDGPKEAALVDIATQLVESMGGTFNLADYSDLSMRQYKGLINDKILGNVPTAPVLAPTPTVDKKMDLMALLTGALAANKGKAKSAAA
jgi:DNA end-binding protein Ku